MQPVPFDFTSIMLHGILKVALQFWWMLPLLLVGLVVKTMAESRRRRPSRLRTPRYRDRISQRNTRPVRLSTETDDDVAAERGREGEALVTRMLERHGIPHVSDVYLEIGKGATQVDHVVLLGDEVLVVETKNYSGNVLAGTDYDRWKVYHGNVSNSFQNPLDQNERHVEAVTAHFPAARIRGVVVFVGSATFAKGKPPGVFDTANFERMLALNRKATPSPALVRAWSDFAVMVSSRDRTELVRRHRASVAGGRAARFKRYYS